MSVAIVTFYAGLNALIAFVLAQLVVRQRHKTGISLGTGGNPALEQAVRAHGNFVEYVPFILFLLLLLELGGVSAVWLHLMGATLTVGRILHAWGLISRPGSSVGRAVGITLTLVVMLAALIVAIVQGAAAL